MRCLIPASWGGLEVGCQQPNKELALGEKKLEVLFLFSTGWPYACILLLVSKKLGITIKINQYIFILQKAQLLLDYVAILSLHFFLNKM